MASTKKSVSEAVKAELKQSTVETQGQTVQTNLKSWGDNFTDLITTWTSLDFEDTDAESCLNSDHEETDLVLAIRENNKPNIYAMIQEGVDLDAQNSEGYSALMIAIILQQPYAVAALIKAGVRLKLKNNDGETAETLATATGNVVIRSFVQAAMDRENSKSAAAGISALPGEGDAGSLNASGENEGAQKSGSGKKSAGFKR